ncbi:hypothetical protein, partial [Komagataeibacter saccharivorans]|uniref:hypothetical protein n=1 Tax=Komagataeibacter saccharivorans TaxID=265959 RepID=UPI0039E7B520
DIWNTVIPFITIFINTGYEAKDPCCKLISSHPSLYPQQKEVFGEAFFNKLQKHRPGEEPD